MVDDRFGRANLRDLLQAVVAVDDAAVQVIQVGRGEASAVQLHHRAQFGRDDRNGIQDHPVRTRFAGDKRFGDLQALDGADALRPLRVGDFVAQFAAEFFQVDLGEQLS